MRVRLITDCMDLMAGFELLNHAEQLQILQMVIDTLGSYPKPQKKADTLPAPTKAVGAYLFVSNVRNACKLHAFGFIPTESTKQAIDSNLSNALSLLQL